MQAVKENEQAGTGRTSGIIAMDLDGTVLNGDKRMTERTRKALEAAAESGIWVVPATGRILKGLPEEMLELPWIRYMILANGAMVWDRETESCLYRAEISLETGLEVLRWLDGFQVIYDCYQENQGWMTASMLEQAETYAPSPFFLQHIRRLRKPVPDLKEHVRRSGKSLQKIQAFCRTDEVQREVLARTAERFPELSVSTSIPRNAEINDGRANKGAALAALAERLGIPMEKTAAFGDGINDLSMIRAAGAGIAMGNAEDAIRAAADRTTADNENDGVGIGIETLMQENFWGCRPRSGQPYSKR